MPILDDDSVPASTDRERAFADARPSHILALDGLRGLAICLVLIHHFISMQNTPGKVAMFISSVSGSLWCGVDLFFVLSGFLVTRVLLDAPRGPGYFRTFYIRRTLRIFPLYYLAVLAALGVTALNVTQSLGLPQQKATYLPLLFYVTNFATLWPTWTALGSLFVFWSLAVEEHFYLLWPFVVARFSRPSMLRICGLVMVVAFACRVLMYFVGVQPAALYTLTFCRMDALAAGAATCLLIDNGSDTADQWRKLAKAVCGVSGLAVLAMVLATRGHGLDPSHPLVQTVGYSVVAVFMAGLLTIVVTGVPSHPLVRLCRSAPLRWFGRYSYGIYVFHTIALCWVIANFTPAAGAGRTVFILSGLLRPAVGVTAAVATAWLSYNLMERHMLRLKDVLAPVRLPATHAVAGMATANLAAKVST